MCNRHNFLNNMQHKTARSTQLFQHYTKIFLFEVESTIWNVIIWKVFNAFILLKEIPVTLLLRKLRFFFFLSAQIWKRNPILKVHIYAKCKEIAECFDSKKILDWWHLEKCWHIRWQNSDCLYKCAKFLIWCVYESQVKSNTKTALWNRENCDCFFYLNSKTWSPARSLEKTEFKRCTLWFHVIIYLFCHIT